MDRCPPIFSRRLAAIALAALVAGGCRLTSPREYAIVPVACSPAGARVEVAYRATVPASAVVPMAPPAVAPQTAEVGEATLAAAEKAERRSDETSVDLYYRAALQLAPWADALPTNDPAAGSAYQRALNGLIRAGQNFGRLDPRSRLVIRDSTVQVVPVKHYGFAWKPGDFSELAAAELFQSDEIAHRYFKPGLGVALVAERIAVNPDELFFRHRQPFGVTAVLRPVVPEGPGQAEAVLELYNPHTWYATTWNGGVYRLSRDLTAMYAAVINGSPRQYLRGFTAPSDTSVKPKLMFVEPYQRGKIPIIFIHGLYSDPVTWVDTANDLRAMADLNLRYQFWVFRYPTGGEVLDSAAQLREMLQLARQIYDPQHEDPALDQMLLVGHSLGGLVAQTQIVMSYDILWNSIANQPFAMLRAPPALRERLERSFFFAPQPTITRVVFIGTPHRGSTYSRRLAGRIGSALVSFDTQEKEQYRELMDANPDVFKSFVSRSRPTTVDMLSPTSPFLIALAQMPINPAVHMHSIIGTGGLAILGEPGDGVVSVSSAQQAGVESELYVPAKHEKLHRDPASVAEIARIMRLHAGQLNLPPPVETSP